VEEFGDRDLQAFLKNFPRLRRQNPPADVRCMAAVREVTYDSIVPENGRHHCEVIDLPRRLPGIISYENIAWL